MHLFIPAVRLHHGALKWAWEFFDRIFDANAIIVQYEYSQISDTLACCEMNVTYP